MKKTLKTKICNYILVLLGLAATTSCEQITRETPCEYGTPIMDFEVSGKVVDKDSAPIAGIKVFCHTDSEHGHSTVFTAGDGSFSISWIGGGPYLYFQDIDGPDNGGEFEEKFEEIKCERIGFNPDIISSRWYLGTYGAKDVVIRMEEKK